MQKICWQSPTLWVEGGQLLEIPNNMLLAQPAKSDVSKCCIPIAIRAWFEHDSTTRAYRDDYDSSTQYNTTSYEEPTRSYAHSSNNEHVSSFVLLYSIVANQRVGRGAFAMT